MNERGWGVWSSACVGRTLPGPPDAPEAPTFRWRASTSVRVIWLPPPTTNGAPVLSYRWLSSLRSWSRTRFRRSGVHLPTFIWRPSKIFFERPANFMHTLYYNCQVTCEAQSHHIFPGVQGGGQVWGRGLQAGVQRAGAAVQGGRTCSCLPPQLSGPGRQFGGRGSLECGRERANQTAAPLASLLTQFEHPGQVFNPPPPPHTHTHPHPLTYVSLVRT